MVLCSCMNNSPEESSLPDSSELLLVVDHEPQKDSFINNNKPNISLTFNHSISSPSINNETFKVEDSSGNSLSGSFSFSMNNKKINFDLSENIKSPLKHKIITSSNIESDNGIKFKSNYSWSFQTYSGDWTQSTSNAPWSARHSHTSLVFNNKIWVLGGNDGSRKNDVWHSNNGSSWTLSKSNASWSARFGHSSVVFDNKIWILGGSGFNSASKYLNDVWYSTDGIDWIQATSNASWVGRKDFCAVVFNGKIWILGGNRGHDSHGYYTNDVWYSSNGESLNKSTNPWLSGRSKHNCIVYNKKIWVLGGYSPSLGVLNEVWSTSNGSNWSYPAIYGSWAKRVHFTSIKYDNKIWILGGNDYMAHDGRNDIWNSTNGYSWELIKSSSDWSDRSMHTSVVFDNKIWVLGGIDSSYIKKNDVWYW